VKIYMDWEFLEDGETIAPISVALVREDGREYYAVNADMPVGRIMQHDWLRANVVPSLPIIRHDGIRPFKKPFLDCAHPDVKRRDQIASEVRQFIVGTPSVELWGWYSAYDHVCLAQLFGRMIDLPTGIPMWTNDLKQEAERLGNPQMPEQESGVHNALADARHIKVMADHLTSLRLGEQPWPAGDRLYGKYYVRRADGREKPGADYFVLNIATDREAQTAALAFADVCENTRPGLAGDLRARIAAYRTPTTRTETK
jgi:hypothetical protein